MFCPFRSRRFCAGSRKSILCVDMWLNYKSGCQPIVTTSDRVLADDERVERRQCLPWVRTKLRDPQYLTYFAYIRGPHQAPYDWVKGWGEKEGWVSSDEICDVHYSSDWFGIYNNNKKWSLRLRHFASTRLSFKSVTRSHHLDWSSLNEKRRGRDGINLNVAFMLKWKGWGT